MTWDVFLSGVILAGWLWFVFDMTWALGGWVCRPAEFKDRVRRVMWAMLAPPVLAGWTVFLILEMVERWQ